MANFGVDVSFVTKLPAHEIGQAALNSLRRFGVDTSKVQRGGDRIGIYFIEKGASQRASRVIYDRAQSAISQAVASDFDWDAIFKGAEWFHFTGITPALGGYLPEICEQACKAAKARGITVSCDLNYRKKLWTREQARNVMTQLMQYVDICIANEEDAKDVFGISAKDSDIVGGTLSHEGYNGVAKTLLEQFQFKKVAITLRGSKSASDNVWAGMLYNGKEFLYSQSYNVHIVDRVGGGDSFGAGLIYSMLAGKTDRDALEFAVAASCLKHTVEGDFNMVSAGEAAALAAGDGSGRVQR